MYNNFAKAEPARLFSEELRRQFSGMCPLSLRRQVCRYLLSGQSRRFWVEGGGGC